jgi:hypothetical protein
MCSEDDKKNPRPVHVTLAEDVKTGKDGQTEGMERQVSSSTSPHLTSPPFNDCSRKHIAPSQDDYLYWE